MCDAAFAAHHNAPTLRTSDNNKRLDKMTHKFPCRDNALLFATTSQDAALSSSPHTPTKSKHSHKALHGNECCRERKMEGLRTVKRDKEFLSSILYSRKRDKETQRHKHVFHSMKSDEERNKTIARRLTVDLNAAQEKSTSANKYLCGQSVLFCNSVFTLAHDLNTSSWLAPQYGHEYPCATESATKRNCATRSATARPHTTRAERNATRNYRAVWSVTSMFCAAWNAAESTEIWSTARNVTRMSQEHDRTRIFAVDVFPYATFSSRLHTT